MHKSDEGRTTSRPPPAELRIRATAMMRVRCASMIIAAMLIAGANLAFGDELPHLDLCQVPPDCGLVLP